MDEMTPDDRGMMPALFIGPMTRMGERLAANAAEIVGLKKDTEMIRTSVHDINNHLQASLAAERDCALALASLSGKVAAQSEMITLKMATQLEKMSDLSTDVQALMQTRNQAQGAWWAILKIGALIVAVASATATGLASLWWAAQHLK